MFRGLAFLRVLSPKNGTLMYSENLVKKSGYAQLMPQNNNKYNTKLQKKIYPIYVLFGQQAQQPDQGVTSPLCPLTRIL